MLRTSVCIAENRKNKEYYDNLGVDVNPDSEYFKIQYNVDDIQFHHEYVYETSNEEVLDDVVVIQFKNGMRVLALENFEDLEKARIKREKFEETKRKEYLDALSRSES